MLQRMLALAATGLMLASGCSTPQPLPQTVSIPIPPPAACAAPCPPLPALEASSEQGAVMWIYELIDTAGECRRMHNECREAKE